MGTNGSTMLEPLRQGLPPIDQAKATSSASCSLSARYEAVRGARKFTRATLRDWNLDDCFDDVSLVVSELVTNALRHAVPDETRQTQDPPVRLHLMRWPGRLVCAVRDPSPVRPGASLGSGAYGEGGGGLGGDSPGNGSSGNGSLHGVNGRSVTGAPSGGGLPAGGAFDDGSFCDESFGDESLGDGGFGDGSFGEGSPFPDPRGPAESGRGLFLVDAFSDSWGWHPLAGALHGKVVWALFRLS
ncbi:ATP-binding protein [Streptomyces sp. NPDC051018]|uniref:ATP-binding protein n=1 Tax=Streptomyces sp. NPDC051018 TaxID=3365639 RepID=UPI0037951526